MAKEKTKAEYEKEQRAKSAAYERKLKNKNNKFIVISAVLILLGYLFFLLSPKIFHEKPERFYTDIGTEVAFTGGSITPNSWIYAEHGKMMQVEFTFKSNQIIAPEIEVKAATSYTDRTKPSSKLKSEVIYHENDFYIANIYDIPDDYYCVSLRITTVEDKTTATTERKVAGDGIGNDVVRQLEETKNTAEEKQTIPSTAVIYTCKDAVDLISRLYPLDDYIYRIKRIQSNIVSDYLAIDDNNTNIKELKEINSELHNKNKELSDEMLYMTTTEKQYNETEIDNNEKKINDNTAKIRGLEESNDALNTEIAEYSEIIKRIAAESEGREYIAPTEDMSQEPTQHFVNPAVPSEAVPSENATEKPTDTH